MVQLVDSALTALYWTLAYESNEQKTEERLAVQIGEISGLKNFPVAAQKVLSLLNQHDFAIDEIADTICQDPSLTAGVLRLANSPFYHPAHPVVSLDATFIRLGRSAIREMVFAVAIMQLFPSTDGLCRLIRDHCASTAAISHRLSSHLHIGTPEIMFIAGLMHDIGRLLLIDSGEVHYDIAQENQEEPFQNSAKLRQIEIDQVFFDHAVLGAQVLSSWKVSSPIPQVVAYHHLPELAWNTPEVGSLVAVLRLADAIDKFTSKRYTKRSEFITQLVQSDDACRLQISAIKISNIWSDLVTAKQSALALFS